ncbi:hypothetical protein AGMMS49921_07100 [Endomicrobiia bacterium]|nr:hypothetical protein AGMMS49921_07100 [Endomicrobiia bacterium]
MYISTTNNKECRYTVDGYPDKYELPYNGVLDKWEVPLDDIPADLNFLSANRTRTQADMIGGEIRQKTASSGHRVHMF